MNWLRQHAFALSDAFGHLSRAPGNFFLNVLVVAIALALPCAGLTLLENIRPVSEQLSVEPELSVFLKMDAPRSAALAMAGQIDELLQHNDMLGSAEFIPREKAFDALKKKTGLSSVLTTLGGNPLPDSYVVRLTGLRNAMDAARVDLIADQLQALPHIDSVQIDSAWVKRLAALLRILRMLLLFLGGTLSLAVVAVVFNTIRMQVLTQYEEIEVSRLLGATDAFIHRPFYYTGALLGLAAGVLGLGAVALSLLPLNQTIAEFAYLYGSEFRLAPLSLWPSLGLLAVSALLGLLGAMLSVRRHLRRLQ
ncbi:permease-like cell division protein FtsX [Herbaspirillum sp. RTI4]|uniref:permease-like cell division protein FtsX n=1 Tax=Herbaspirillum sp. RTI4 TaxID=3048640 RepID=UPI002AB4AFBD|nr:permease-like cell division protein FtsX [Herbaspirillum sp. RTI4]MDY7577708.1 permease-like cell division protein FtsX [Herbaspirillum sp. RTI4]MEA9980864.1 permease-like cell division protein FtsX [Herbaspirillum sp. RTI4]